jgi:5-methyltetrahydrofolate--homocysteine methyltransferase
MQMLSWTSLVLDGAMGTELAARGQKPGEDAPESWNLTHPAEVQAIYRAYFEAGAGSVHTNSWGASRMRLRNRRGGPADVRAINVAAAVLAREVRPPGTFVIGSIGPTGAVPPPEGRADLSELEDTFAEQAAALAEGGVDLLHLETMAHPKEARAALRGVRQGAPGLKVVASMTCKMATPGYCTPLGFTPEVMLSVFLEEQADGVGANCNLGPTAMVELVRFLRARTPLPVFAQPTPTTGPYGQVSSSQLASGGIALFAAGASAVGGCCGATPDDISALVQAVARERAAAG